MFNRIYKMTPQKVAAIHSVMQDTCPELTEFFNGGMEDALSTTDSGRPRRILGQSTKVNKGAMIGILTAVVYMSPSSVSGLNFCPWSTVACVKACLRNHGRMSMGLQTRAQLYKSWWFLLFFDSFMEKLKKEIEAHVKRAEKLGMIPAIRLNGTSDIPWEKTGLFELFPTVRFYDYTKAKLSKRSTPENYHLTYSVSDKRGSLAEGKRYIASGGNAAIVVGDKAMTATGGKAALAAIIGKDSLFGLPVINGDKTDVRFLDKPGAFVVLAAKGPIARRDESGFVKRTL